MKYHNKKTVIDGVKGVIADYKPVRRTVYYLPTEAEIQASILDYLNMKGHYCWRNSSGKFKVGDRYINVGKGRADIIGIASDSRFIAVEVKKKGGKASEEQKAFINEIKGRGGVGLIAYSLEEVMEVL